MSDKYASDLPLPGGVEQYYDTLIHLLCRVREEPLNNEQLLAVITNDFPSGTRSTAIAGYVRLISRMGLWTTKDGTVRLTPLGNSLVATAEADPSAGRR